MNLTKITFSSYDESVKKAVDSIKADDVFVRQSSILIKPNLVNASPHPVTTPAVCCEAIIRYVRSCSNAEIVIAEGCGDSSLETGEIFKRLGYTNIAEQYDISLIDLNTSPLKKLENSECLCFPEIYLPEIAFSHFIVSVPVLKAHSFSTITGTMKNMIGFAPPKYYSGSFGTWNKSVFHDNMHQAIIDLNRYRHPDVTLMDATIGLADFHLGGKQCDPPVNQLVAGFDPVEVDREAAGLLSLDWKRIPHLAKRFPDEV
ncbi:MAG: DUF362 domain-containing protein [Deltaproteobacteria bacterium]|nr:DUF362 domain-containing protein [Deltaproteobacteria bacterium]